MTIKSSTSARRRTRPVLEHFYTVPVVRELQLSRRTRSKRRRCGEEGPPAPSYLRNRDVQGNTKDRGRLDRRRRGQRGMRARRPPERGSRQGRRAPGGRSRLAGERGAAGVAQPQRLAGAGRVGVRGVPVAGARVAAHARAGAAAARAGTGPRRRIHGQRHDGRPRGARRLRPLGRLRMPRLVVRRHAALPAADGERRRLRRAALPRRGRADPGAAPAARAWGLPTTRSRRRRARSRPSVVRRPQRPHGHGRLAVRAQRARDGARRHDQRRLPGARARPPEPAGPRRRHGRARARRGGSRHRRPGSRRGRLDRRARRGHRAVRGRDPLTRDPAALGHRPRRAGRAAARGPRDAGASARAVLALPATGRAARAWTRGRPTASCATPPSSRRGRERHADRVGQPDARPPGGGRVAPRHGRPGRNLGRRRWRPRRRRSGSPVPVGEPAELRGWLGLTSPDPDVAPRIEQRLLDDPADLVRMRDGVKRCLELVAGGAFARGLRAHRHRHDRHRPGGTGRRRRDRRVADGDGRRHGSHLRHLPDGRARRSAKPWSTRKAACSASTACGWPTRPSSRRSRARTRTCRPSPPPSGCRTSSAASRAARPVVEAGAA